MKERDGTIKDKEKIITERDGKIKDLEKEM